MSFYVMETKEIQSKSVVVVVVVFFCSFFFPFFFGFFFLKFFGQKKEKNLGKFSILFTKKRTRERDQQLFLLLLSFNDFDVNERKKRRRPSDDGESVPSLRTLDRVGRRRVAGRERVLPRDDGRTIHLHRRRGTRERVGDELGTNEAAIGGAETIPRERWKPGVERGESDGAGVLERRASTRGWV